MRVSSLSSFFPFYWYISSLLILLHYFFFYYGLYISFVCYLSPFMCVFDFPNILVLFLFMCLCAKEESNICCSCSDDGLSFVGSGHFILLFIIANASILFFYGAECWHS